MDKKESLSITTENERTSSSPLLRPSWSCYVRSRRKKMNLTLGAAARRMGVSIPTWVGLETGTRLRGGVRRGITPTPETLDRIAVVLAMNAVERLYLHTSVGAPTQVGDVEPWQYLLRTCREQANLTLSDAASHATITIPTYRRWEQGSVAAPLRKNMLTLLPYLSLDALDRATLLAACSGPVAHPPRRNVAVVIPLPRWSTFITECRCSTNMSLSEVDTLIGQGGIIRIMELGGWLRVDGRLSVPTYDWLNRIADVLQLSKSSQSTLNDLADRERLAQACQGSDDLLVEVLREARRAASMTAATVNKMVPELGAPWSHVEGGIPSALAALAEPGVLDRTIEALRVGNLLAGTIVLLINSPAMELI